MENEPCTLIEDVELKAKIISSRELKMYKKGEHAVHNIENERQDRKSVV